MGLLGTFPDDGLFQKSEGSLTRDDYGRPLKAQDEEVSYAYETVALPLSYTGLAQGQNQSGGSPPLASQIAHT